jgi:hypothetical protein
MEGALESVDLSAVHRPVAFGELGREGHGGDGEKLLALAQHGRETRRIERGRGIAHAAGQKSLQPLLDLRDGATIRRMAEGRAHDGARRTADGEARNAADDLSPKHESGLTRDDDRGDINKRGISMGGDG